MRIYVAGRHGQDGTPEFETDVSRFSWFHQNEIKQLMEHGARLVLLAGEDHDFSEVIQLDETGYTAFRKGRAVLIADQGYPAWVACELARRINKDESLTQILHDAQDPEDVLSKCQNESAELLDIMHTNIDKVLERQHRLHCLVEQTEALERQAILFRRTVRKSQSRCPRCSLL